MKHITLIEEVITQLQSRFKPKVQDIKKCIDILLVRQREQRGRMFIGLFWAYYVSHDSLV